MVTHRRTWIATTRMIMTQPSILLVLDFPRNTLSQPLAPVCTASFIRQQKSGKMDRKQCLQQRPPSMDDLALQHSSARFCDFTEHGKLCIPTPSQRRQSLTHSSPLTVDPPGHSARNTKKYACSFFGLTAPTGATESLPW